MSPSPANKSNKRCSRCLWKTASDSLPRLSGVLNEEKTDIDESWLKEVKRRIATYERDETQLIDHDEVMRQVDEDLGDMKATS